MALLKDAVLSAAADPVFGAHTTPLIAPSRPDELRGYMFCHNPSAPRRAKKHPHAFLDPPFLFNVQKVLKVLPWLCQVTNPVAKDGRARIRFVSPWPPHHHLMHFEEAKLLAECVKEVDKAVGRDTHLAMQLLYILQDTVFGHQELRPTEELYFRALHAAFRQEHPDQEHDVVTWARAYVQQAPASHDHQPILSAISQQIVAWCDAQQPVCQLHSVPGSTAASQLHQDQDALINRLAACPPTVMALDSLELPDADFSQAASELYGPDNGCHPGMSSPRPEEQQINQNRGHDPPGSPQPDLILHSSQQEQHAFMLPSPDICLSNSDLAASGLNMQYAQERLHHPEHINIEHSTLYQHAGHWPPVQQQPDLGALTQASPPILYHHQAAASGPNQHASASHQYQNYSSGARFAGDQLQHCAEADFMNQLHPSAVVLQPQQQIQMLPASPHMMVSSSSSAGCMVRQAGKRPWQDAHGASEHSTVDSAGFSDVLQQDRMSISVAATPQARRQRTTVLNRGRQNDSSLYLTAAKIHDALLLEAGRGNSGLQDLVQAVPDLAARVSKELLRSYQAFARSLIAEPDLAARSALALGAARQLEKYGLEGLNYAASNFHTPRPSVDVFINVLDLLKASGQNPHVNPYTVIKAIWQQSHPESYAFAEEEWGKRSKPQPYSQHYAQERAEPFYPMTGKSKQEHLEKANSLKLTRRADLVINEVDTLHKLIAQLSLNDADRSALHDDIRSLYQVQHGKYNKQQSIEVFRMVAHHQGFWPDTDTQGIDDEQNQLPAVLKRDFAIDSPRTSSNISLHVTGSPDFLWPSGVVKLKNRMYAEDDMKDKWRLGDHAESCLYHILSATDPNLDHAKYRYMVEHMRVGDDPSLRVHCRDKPYCRTGGRQFVVNDIPDGAAGTMVITRYSMEESLQFWETQFIPHVEKFCRVLARLFFDRSYQTLFMMSANQQEWYAEYADEA